MDVVGDVSGFAELQKALAKRIALPDDRLPFVKAHIFAPSVFGKVLARGQFRIRQGPHEVSVGRDHNDILKKMRRVHHCIILSYKELAFYINGNGP